MWHRQIRDCTGCSAPCQGMLSPREDAQHQGGMLSPKGRNIQRDGRPQGGMLSSWEGCSAPGEMLSTRQDGSSSPALQPTCPRGMGCLATTAHGSHPPQEWDVVPTVGGRMWKSHLQNPTDAFPPLILQLHSLLFSVCPHAHPLAPAGPEGLECWKRSWGCRDTSSAGGSSEPLR